MLKQMYQTAMGMILVFIHPFQESQKSGHIRGQIHGQNLESTNLGLTVHQTLATARVQTADHRPRILTADSMLRRSVVPMIVKNHRMKDTEEN